MYVDVSDLADTVTSAQTLRTRDKRKKIQMHAQLIRRAAARTISATNSATLYRSFADDAAVGLTGRMKLNFNLPQLTLYDSADVSSVVVPGAMGEYEVTANHVPIVAELKAGLLTIKRGEGIDERYFIPGGFSLTHAGSVTVSFQHP